MIYARDVTPEMAVRARKLANEIKKLMEDNFLLPPNEAILQKLAAKYQELQDMGLHVSHESILDLRKKILTVHVTIYVLKSTTGSA